MDFRDDTESLAAKCKEYEKELERLRKENEQQKEELYKAKKALSDKDTLLEQQTRKRTVEKQELNDLRELIFALTNDAGERGPARNRAPRSRITPRRSMSCSAGIRPG